MPAVPLNPPARLVRTLPAWEGEAGRAWLDKLPGLVREYLDRWELTPERVLEPGGNISMIVLVRQRDGGAAILKLGMVTAETEHEPAALAHWHGRGAARLLRADPDQGALLLERLRADVSLRSLPEQQAMLEAAGVAQRLWGVPPAADHPFTTVTAYTAGLAALLRERVREPWAAAAAPLVDEALRLREQLVASHPEQVVLHGDFHHGNVLAGDRLPWLAIDPKPLVGEPAYDLAWLVRDRVETLMAAPGPEAAARRRVRKLAAALEVDRERLRGWSVFRSVEAGVWCLAVGDSEGGELLLEFAAWL